jgi:hypothetical protein
VWDDLQRFLDYLITKYGVLRVLLGPFAAIGLLAGAGIITGGGVSLTATGASLFIALIIITALSLQLRSARHLSVERARIVNFYIHQFAQSDGPYSFTLEDWDERVTINKHGDAVLERWVTIRVEDEKLYSIWSGAYTQADVNDALRRRVKAEARGFDENNGTRVLGARYDVTSEWEGKRIRLFVHFERPASAGDIVRIWLRWEWPAYYEGLLNGQTDIVEWSMHRPTKHIAGKLIFDKASHAKSFHITTYAGCPMPKQEPQPDGGLAVSAEYHNVEPETTVGFRIDRGTTRG